MTEKLQVTIVGLGLLGASAGLALRRYADRVTVVGHDRDSGLASAAKRAGAVERTDWNLISAVSRADRVLLAVPVSELRSTLAAIAQDLTPGCVLLDVADVKAQVLAWAAELLPPTVHFVGGHPILVTESLDPADARADLFQGKLFCLTPATNADSSSVHLAADLVESLGAKPFFLDALEHDGLAAQVEHLPQMLAGGLMSLAAQSPSWQDMRKLAGSQFYSSTLIAAGDGRAVAGSLLANRDQTLRSLDALAEKLEAWRRLLTDGDEAALAQQIDAGLAEGHKWVSAQARGNWDADPSAPDLPTSGSMLRDLIGFGKWRKPPVRSKRT